MEMTSSVHIIFDNACTNDITSNRVHPKTDISCVPQEK